MLYSNCERKKVCHRMNLQKKFMLQDRRYPVGKTGNAVPNIDRLSELSHLFNATINEMLEDMDLLYELTDR